MSKHTTWSIARAVCLSVVTLLWAAALPAQESSFVVITPAKVTLLIGQSASFRLVDQDGHAQRDVFWTVSDSTALQAVQGDQFAITAKHAGHFFVGARSAKGAAEATVEVMDGAALPAGTVRWAGAAIEGCTTTKIIQAVPTPNGPDLYEQSQCKDGSYIAAYTVDGIQLWRRKVGAGGAPPATALDKAPMVIPQVDFATASFCDGVSVGTTQQRIRALLEQHRVAFNEGSPGEHAWVVEERNAECKLWFDEKLLLTRKRKTLLN
jgi:hypothetical protein